VDLAKDPRVLDLAKRSLITGKFGNFHYLRGTVLILNDGARML
jgi:hypothetical protein